MSEYLCKTCGQPAPKPLWLIAREKGFDGSRHCIVAANKSGAVCPCIMLEKGPTCEYCKIGKALGVGKK